MTVLVTGGAGYLGSVLSLALLDAGCRVRIVDNLTYGGRGLLPLLGHPRLEAVAADIRDATAMQQAMSGVDAIVHLAAIVGDPACAQAPDLARAVNRDATMDLITMARRSPRVSRFVFASTCSNYGRMRDTSVLATETHELRPLSLYAETKVAVERQLLDAPPGPIAFTVLRFATLFGVSPRMRFDLTVNQFVMEMLMKRRVTVYGERFWRPYVHVRDAASGIVAALMAPVGWVAGKVFNVGDTQGNYRKVDLIRLIEQRVSGADVTFVSVAEDPRDYRVSFERIREVLGFRISRTVPEGIDEIADALEMGAIGAFDDPSFVNTRVFQRPVAQVVMRAACAP